MSGNAQLASPVRAEGPWPFVTRRSYSVGRRRIVWLSRQHRKGLDLKARALDASIAPFWQSASYNWGIGAVFALGAGLFMLGAMLSLISGHLLHVSGLTINIVFFLGSIPFTVAAYLQHFQAANAPSFTTNPQEPSHRRITLVGWHPWRAGWLSTFTQLLGTLAFNANTLNAALDPTRWYVEDAAIWLPDMVGSTLFLASGYLAFIEVSHRYWSWMPKDLSWRIVFINFLGCVAFMTSAILSYVPRSGEAGFVATLSTVHTLIGALCFFVGAILTCRESRGAAR
ncbi:hypothetical protein FPY71_16035 [Aureimonas fodinaquatilis]|uniref:YrhK domain-containing protein n=1 Tax=Aureimonas fodinaquatilis TaxID=2565783 RepID=A0A5B0DSU1_9HYPH|nr:hypothetical protein [Aureimonas fodinaquatilis]KAA0969055.1 hypothetical protein FPY71_16035 [Aureimonas fodinaquatilis]